MPKKLPSKKAMTESAANLLTDYKVQQQKNCEDAWFYAPTGYTVERIDDINFIQIVARDIESYGMPAEKPAQKAQDRFTFSKYDAIKRFSNKQHGVENKEIKKPTQQVTLSEREEQTIERGKQYILAGLFALEMELINSSRSALYKVCQTAINGYDFKNDPVLLQKCYSELATFFTQNAIDEKFKLDSKTAEGLNHYLITRIYELNAEIKKYDASALSI